MMILTELHLLIIISDFSAAAWSSSYLFPSRVPNRSSRSLVAGIAAVASCGGRGDDFHNFFDPAQVDGIVPGKFGWFLQAKMGMKPTVVGISRGKSGNGTFEI